jgi:hypothetical protein
VSLLWEGAGEGAVKGKVGQVLFYIRRLGQHLYDGALLSVFHCDIERITKLENKPLPLNLFLGVTEVA